NARARQPGKQAESRRKTAARGAPSRATLEHGRRRSPSGLGGLLRRLDLAALVVAAGSARAVRRHRLAAVRASDELHGRHLVVVGATHVALRSAGASLRDGHGRTPLEYGCWV